MMPYAVESVARHHLPGTGVVFAPPGTLIPVERDPEPTSGLIQHPDAFGHHLLSDAVTRNQRNPVLAHCTPTPSNSCTDRARCCARCYRVPRLGREISPFSLPRYPTTRDFGEHT